MKNFMLVIFLLVAYLLVFGSCGNGNGEQDVREDEGLTDVYFDQLDVQEDEQADIPSVPDADAIIDTFEEEVLLQDVSDVGDEFETPEGLRWITIPPGSYEMGCSPGDISCNSPESPRHTVNVSAFRITEMEITQAQYETVTGETPSYFTSCGEHCPVEQVNWHEAKAFCEVIGGRLPSEAEWEYAARGDTTTRYYCGDDAVCLGGIAWYNANSVSTTHPVGEKTVNAFGLYDMLGNVWEWVEDCWHSDYTSAPSTGEVWSGGDCGYRVVLRGGSYDDDVWFLRASDRSWFEPVSRFRYGGFRCAQ